MDARAFDKSKLPSHHITEGRSRAHRSYAIFKRTPYIGDLKPAGCDVAKDVCGDMIASDAERDTLDPDVGAVELKQRRARCKAPANPYQSGALRKYADSVGPACKGAVTHAGGSAEIVCYADI